MAQTCGLVFLGMMVGWCVGCAPVNPSVNAVAGRWTVDWTCGVETLDLNANGTYGHTIEFAAGGRATDSGTWRLVPKSERLEGAHVILQNAPETCSTFGERISKPQRIDRQLEAIWEWGRMILSFNPDIQGFTRGE